MTVRTERVSPGETVSILGYPDGNQLQVSSGAALEYVVDLRLAPREILKVTTPVRPGNSGGPVVDRHGKVVGVIYATEIATEDTLVIPIDDVFGPQAVPLEPQRTCSPR